MDNQKFIDICKNEISDYLKGIYDIDFKAESIYVVWSCKTLQNNKALLSTNQVNGLYFECTYNGDKKELYLDVYAKVINKCVEVDK